MSVRWFGESWGAPVCSPDRRVATPAGEPCYLCERPLAQGDIGLVVPFHGGAPGVYKLAAHHSCFMRHLGLGPGP